MEESTLKDSSVLEALKKFIVVRLNIDDAKSITFEFKVKSVPWILAVNPSNRDKISDLVGFADVQTFLAFLDDVSKKYQPSTGSQDKSEKKFNFIYKRTGFSFESSDKDIVIDMWTYHLIESVSFLDKDFDGDATKIKQSRFGLQSTLYNNTTFLTHLDFALDKPLLDLYVEYQVTRPINVRVGRFKVPMGTQFLPRRDYWDFVEPSYYTFSLLPRRDLGGMVYGGGGLYGIYMKYWLGVFNGVQDGYTDTDNSKDFAGRLTLNPFPSPEFDFNFSYSWTAGRSKESLSTFKVTDESITGIMSFLPGSAYDGFRSREGWELELLWRNFAVGAEQITQNSHITGGKIVDESFQMKGNAVWLAWIITGEKKSRDEWLIPKNKLGAFEIVSRFSSFSADDELSSVTQSGKFTESAKQYLIGLNWYLTRYTRLMLDYLYSKYDDDVEIKTGTREDLNRTILGGFEVHF
ncbi:MAG: hypothetical protein HY606_04530 [Planctomycetes bacterium]|nr:hypothetical protein [Planctomycetota bacterium]